jgi:hypothetical protein
MQASETDDPIEALYQESTMWAEGTTVAYRGYQLRKVESVGLSGRHSEWAVYNQEGAKVESYTVAAFDSAAEFRDSLDEVIEYDPENLRDWLNRAQEGRA